MRLFSARVKTSPYLIRVVLDTIFIQFNNCSVRLWQNAWSTVRHFYQLRKQLEHSIRVVWGGGGDFSCTAKLFQNAFSTVSHF